MIDMNETDKYRVAELNEYQHQQLKAAEELLGVTLVAYERPEDSAAFGGIVTGNKNT
jgi:hypothetical protein